MQVENQKLIKQEIHLDFIRFIRCEFSECVMIFHGYGVVHFDECKFTNVKWTFADAAFRTIDFMASLHAAGAKDLIESMIDKIRQGKPHESVMH